MASRRERRGVHNRAAGAFACRRPNHSRCGSSSHPRRVDAETNLIRAEGDGPGAAEGSDERPAPPRLVTARATRKDSGRSRAICSRGPGAWGVTHHIVGGGRRVNRNGRRASLSRIRVAALFAVMRGATPRLKTRTTRTYGHARQQ